MYLATASGPRIREAMRAGVIGHVVTAAGGSPPMDGVPWMLDNGCYSDAWTSKKWLATLDRLAGVPGCLFAVVPDVVGDAAATNEAWARWHGAVLNRGYRAAYVLQDGCESIPAWGVSAVFVGGTTAWKLGAAARRLVGVAKARGLAVHMGRVNSLRRLRYAVDIGCDTVDGTFLAFGPDINLDRLRAWIDPAQPSMFGGIA